MGEVCQRDENEPAKENVIIKGKPIPNIEVILMYGDEQVPASHHLASLRVELVVLEANYYIAGSTDWPREEFENHFFKMVSKTSAPRMTVEKAIFSLDGGRKVHSVASLKESSGKKKVRLGVMAVDDGSVQERVLEGVSSNEFRVIHGRHAVNKQIKRLVLQKIHSRLRRLHKKIYIHFFISWHTLIDQYYLFDVHADKKQESQSKIQTVCTRASNSLLPHIQLNICSNVFFSRTRTKTNQGSDHNHTEHTLFNTPD